MKKILLLSIVIFQLCLLAQELTYEDIIYLYAHDKKDCDRYLKAKSYSPDEPDYNTDENGCRRYIWFYNDGGDPPIVRNVAKLCADALSGNIRYSTLSNREYENLQMNSGRMALNMIII